jgi:hypothetical protein
MKYSAKLLRRRIRTFRNDLSVANGRVCKLGMPGLTGPSPDGPGSQPAGAPGIAAPEAEDSHSPALTQAAIRFAEAEHARAQVHLQSVVEALSPLEASLLEFQAASARIDRAAIERLWEDSEALLKQMREELAGPPFRAPARSLLRRARRSVERLHTLKPALAQLDALLPRVWGTSALVDGVRELLAEVELSLGTLTRTLTRTLTLTRNRNRNRN